MLPCDEELWQGHAVRPGRSAKGVGGNYPSLSSDEGSIYAETGGTYIATLRFLAPRAVCHRLRPADRGASLPDIEIRHGSGVFWGVQYHPEIDLHEVSGALRRQSDELVGEGYASSPEALEKYASMVEALHQAPDCKDLAWCLRLDEQVTTAECRLTELRNFICFVAEEQ